MQGSKNPFNSLQRILLVASVLIFIALFFILSINNRHAGDDFELLNVLRKYGWWTGMVITWKVWITRWLALLFLNTALVFYNISHSFFLYYVLTLICLYGSIYFLSKNSLYKIFENVENNTTA